MPFDQLSDADLEHFATQARPPIWIGDLPDVQLVANAILESLGALGVPQHPTAAPEEVERPVLRRSATDHLNAVVRRIHVTGRASGLLAGLKIGVKDSMAVAGVPMTCGSALLRDWTPQRSCSVVDRVLDAGGELVAVLNMDDFALSAGGETSVYGAIRNPHDQFRSAGGSSGGSAAALYSTEIDLSFGTDQGGSIRVPAAWCGVLGLKPTFGLVPYTGIVGLDRTIDHVGPLARSVKVIAAALTAVAGPDGRDSRQREPEVADYTVGVADGQSDLKGTRIAVLAEGLEGGIPVEPSTREAFLAAIERIRRLGATVELASAPEHITAGAIGNGILAQAMAATVWGSGMIYHDEGAQDASFSQAFARGLAERPWTLPLSIRAASLAGEHLRSVHHGAVYAAAQEARQVLRRAYDRVLVDYDFLAMPTTPYTAHNLVPDAPMAERVLRGWRMLGNTSPFNLTGHPALTMPAAEAGGLPVGVMIVGRMYAENAILGLASNYENAYGWLPEVS